MFLIPLWEVEAWVIGVLEIIVIMLVLNMIVLAGGFFCATDSGKSWAKKDYKHASGKLLLAAVFMAMASVGFYTQGFGKPARPSDVSEVFEKNAVYKLVSSTQSQQGYAVFIQKPDGDLVALLSDTNPPAVFKYTGNEKNPYQSFP